MQAVRSARQSPKRPIYTDLVSVPCPLPIARSPACHTRCRPYIRMRHARVGPGPLPRHPRPPSPCPPSYIFATGSPIRSTTCAGHPPPAPAWPPPPPPGPGLPPPPPPVGPLPPPAGPLPPPPPMPPRPPPPLLPPPLPRLPPSIGSRGAFGAALAGAAGMRVLMPCPCGTAGSCRRACRQACRQACRHVSRAVRRGVKPALARACPRAAGGAGRAQRGATRRGGGADGCCAKGTNWPRHVIHAFS